MKKLAFYRPACASFVLMMVSALQTTGLSFFVIPASETLGVGRGSFTIYYSLLSILGAFTAPFLGRLVGKHGVHGILFFSSIWTCLGYFGFSYCNHLWSFYLISAIIGGTAGVVVSLTANTILQQAYDSRVVGRLLGLVMAGSGVGGVCISAWLPALIQQHGWRIGYRFVGVCWLALCWLAVALLGRNSHGKRTASASDRDIFGLTQEQALHRPVFYILIAESFILAFSCGMIQHFPPLFTELGIPEVKIGGLMSLMTATLAIGKIIQSFFYNRLGLQKGGITMMVLYIIALLIFTRAELVYPALIGSAIGLGVYTTLIPLLARQVFGTRDFPAIWGLLQASGSVGLFIGAPVWGLAYDVFGSYFPALVGTSLLLCICIFMHLYVAGRSNAVLRP